MKEYIGKRILIMIPVLLGVTLLIFTIMSLVPGDPAAIILGAQATPEAIDELRERMGLDQPFLSRFFEYVIGIVTELDFGTSLINGRNVRDDILMRFGFTFRVALLSMAFAVGIGVPLGITAAVNRNTWKDGLSMTIALLGISMPTFWFALMLSIVFALGLGLFPASGIGGFQHYILPCLAVSMMGIAAMARQTRSSMLEVIRADYITTARSKGQGERKIIYKHALRNALIPVITQAGATFGILLGGTLVVETVFAIPGLGTYMVTAINTRDYPAVQGSVIFVTAAFCVLMLLIDILYTIIDPRIRAQFRKGGS